MYDLTCRYFELDEESNQKTKAIMDSYREKVGEETWAIIEQIMDEMDALVPPDAVSRCYGCIYFTRKRGRSEFPLEVVYSCDRPGMRHVLRFDYDPRWREYNAPH